MTKPQWHRLTASQLADALRARALDPLTLFTHFWDRIEQGPASVWTFLDREHARSQALASQRRWEAGQMLGPLDGMPVAVKDLFDVAGQPTTAGSLTRAHAPVAQQDAPVIQRLRDQGAILIGKTNLSEFAFSGLGINPHFGTPVQDESSPRPRVPGGSSSGSAMALFHGLAPLALGSDTSGSGRIPCSWNGLVGLRPSAGRYPGGGLILLAPTLDVASPMASNVQDLACLDAAMAGMPLQMERPDDPPAKPRLVIAEGPWLQDLEPIVQRAFDAAMHILQTHGWTVVRERQPAWEGAMECQAREGMLVSAQAARMHAALLADAEALAQVHRPVRLRLQQAQALAPGAEQRLLKSREELCAQWRQAVGLQTLVVVPTTPGTAPELAPLLADDAAFAAANLRALRNTFPSSFVDAPSISLPVPCRGAPAGSRPVMGIQFSTVSGHDTSLLRWARLIEAAWRDGVAY